LSHPSRPRDSALSDSVRPLELPVDTSSTHHNPEQADPERMHAAGSVKHKPARKSKRGRTAWLAFAGTLGAALFALGIYLVVTRGQETTDDAQVEADVVQLAAKVGSEVVECAVSDNQAVKKGDLLLKLDDVEFRARTAQAAAELDIANAQLHMALAQEHVVSATVKGGLTSARAMVSSSVDSVASARAQVEAAKAQLERANAEAKSAEDDLGRTRELRAANAATPEQLDHAQAKYDTAHAAVAQAKAGLAVAEQQHNVAHSRVGEAEGKLAQSAPIDAQMAAAHAQAELARGKVQGAEATLELAKKQLEYTTIVAPADGVVSRFTARVGQLIAAGQPFAMLVPHQTYVIANFKETQLENMKPGDRAVVDVDAYGRHRLEGRVESLSGGTGARFSLLPPDNASGNFVKVVQRVPTRIVWSGLPPGLTLRAGLSVNVTVFTNGK